jgi:hypothetical protein
MLTLGHPHSGRREGLGDANAQPTLARTAARLQDEIGRQISSCPSAASRLPTCSRSLAARGCRGFKTSHSAASFSHVGNDGELADAFLTWVERP